MGEVFTTHMSTTHAAYGEALGITTAMADGVIPTVKEPFCAPAGGAQHLPTNAAS